MTSTIMRIEFEDGKLQSIMERLDKAKQEINDCYYELLRMGVLKITPAKQDAGAK